MASTVFLCLAAYFAFPMLKVWLSSPRTFVTNSFLIGPTALVDLRNIFAPSILGVASAILSFFYDYYVLVFTICYHVNTKQVKGGLHGWQWMGKYTGF